MRLIAALLFFLLYLPAAQAAEYTDAVGGRAFLIHLPDTVAGQKNIPVILALHGGGGNAAQFRDQTGLDAAADRNGFMTVYPEGFPSPLLERIRAWNAGNCCGPALRKNSDDVGYISAVIDVLIKKYAADPARIYATGHSNGAMMSYRLGCDLSHKIAAIAPNAGQRPLDSDCRPTRRVPTLHIHGTADPCALYNGGETCGGCVSKAVGFDLPGDLRACPAVRAVTDAQAKRNGCGTGTETVLTKGAVTCERYKSCPQGAAVGLCSVAGMGHHWIGASDGETTQPRRYMRITGPGNADLDAGQLIWDFFSQFKLEGVRR